MTSSSKENRTSTTEPITKRLVISSTAHENTPSLSILVSSTENPTKKVSDAQTGQFTTTSFMTSEGKPFNALF